MNRKTMMVTLGATLLGLGMASTAEAMPVAASPAMHTSASTGSTLIDAPLFEPATHALGSL